MDPTLSDSTDKIWSHHPIRGSGLGRVTAGFRFRSPSWGTKEPDTHLRFLVFQGRGRASSVRNSRCHTRPESALGRLIGATRLDVLSRWAAREVGGHRFQVEVEGKVSGGFTARLGIGSAHEVIEQKSAAKDTRQGIQRLPGRLKWSDVTLSRPLSADTQLYTRRQDVIESRMADARKKCTITIADMSGKPAVVWELTNARPSSLVVVQKAEGGTHARGDDDCLRDRGPKAAWIISHNGHRPVTQYDDLRAAGFARSPFCFQTRAGLSGLNRSKTHAGFPGRLSPKHLLGHLLAGLAGLDRDGAHLQKRQREVRRLLRAVRLQHQEHGMLGLVHPVGDDLHAVLLGVRLADVMGQLPHHLRISRRAGLRRMSVLDKI